VEQGVGWGRETVGEERKREKGRGIVEGMERESVCVCRGWGEREIGRAIRRETKATRQEEETEE